MGSGRRWRSTISSCEKRITTGPATSRPGSCGPVVSGARTGWGLPDRDGWQQHAAVKAAGLPAGTGFHALRHYYARLLIRHGESVKTVQSRLGHASAVETLDTYSPLWPDSDDRTRDAIDSVLGFTADALRMEPAPTS
jgi:integrase